MGLADKIQNYPGPVRDDSIVHSIALYEWRAEMDLVANAQMMEQIIAALDRPPDCVALVTDKFRGHDYSYLGFKRRQPLLQPKNWISLSYLWFKWPHNMHQCMMETRFDPDGRSKQFSIHIDESAVENVISVTQDIEKIVLRCMKPTYGFQFRMPSKWTPLGFVSAYRTSVFDGTGFRATKPEWVESKVEQFHQSYLRRKVGDYETKLRDVFPVNYLGTGHLRLLVGNTSLERWIVANELGLLERLGIETWKWSVPDSQVEICRKALIAEGHLIVTI